MVMLLFPFIQHVINQGAVLLDGAAVDTGPMEVSTLCRNTQQ